MAVAAKGARIFDEAGLDYIDASSGPLAVTLGHGHPRVLAAIAEQFSAVDYVHRTQFRNSAAERLAGLVTERLGGGLDHVMFVSSGSEANEIAMKFAHLYWAAQGRDGQAPVRVELGQLPRQHGRRAERVRAAPVRRAVPAAGPRGRDDHRPAGLPAAGARGQHRRRRVRGPPAGRVRPARPAADRGGLPRGGRRLGQRRARAAARLPRGAAPPVRRQRRAVDQRRGHVRLRPHREVVRLPALRRGAGHRHLRQGRRRRHPAARRRRPVRPASGSGSAAVYPAMSAGHTFTNAPLACAAGIATIEAIEEEGLSPGGRAGAPGSASGCAPCAAEFPFVGDVRGARLHVGPGVRRRPGHGASRPTPPSTSPPRRSPPRRPAG